MNDAVPPHHVGRLQEAGDFIRSRRERLTPSDVGLSAGVRRRTPGLRREEVAMLAGVGTTWYTWLEQGRDIHPSDEVLSAIAAALRLDPTERRHLFVLHDRPTPQDGPATPERIDGPLRRMLDSLTGQPAYVIGRRWDVLAWNRAADVIYGPYDRLKGDQRNVLHLVFADPEHRRLLVDWEAVARASLAMFRADSARYTRDPDFERLIAHLTRESPEFSQWWSRREVGRPLAGEKHIHHPIAGRMTFAYSSFCVKESPDMKLIVFTPSENETAQKLDHLLSSGEPRRQKRRVEKREERFADT